MFQRLSKNEAEVILANNSNALLIDIRDSESYSEGHLEGSVNITQDKISFFIENTPKSYPLLVICYHGNSSQSVAHYFGINGFTEVYSIDGGYEDWVNC